MPRDLGLLGRHERIHAGIGGPVQRRQGAR